MTWLDVGNDGSVDIIRDSDTYYFRSAAFPDIESDLDWIRVRSPQDEPGREFVAWDLAVASELGTSSSLVRLNESFYWSAALRFIEEGRESPQDLLSGAVEPGDGPNSRVAWTVDPSGDLATVDVSHSDLDASGGIEEVAIEAVAPSDVQPSIPREQDLVDADDLEARQLLESTEEWSGLCRTGVGIADPGAVECARELAGDTLVGDWMATHQDGFWAIPEQCL